MKNVKLIFAIGSILFLATSCTENVVEPAKSSTVNATSVNNEAITPNGNLKTLKNEQTIMVLPVATDKTPVEAK